MTQTAMPEKVFVRMPSDLYNDVEKYADLHNIGISTAIRKLAYVALDRLDRDHDSNRIFRR